MHYNQENSTGIGSEIEYMDEFYGESVSDSQKPEAVSSEEKKTKPATKEKKKTSKAKNASDDYYTIRLRISARMRERIRIFSILEDTNVEQFYVDSISERLERLSRKYSDMQKFKSYLEK